jgi:hypothetical protein
MRPHDRLEDAGTLTGVEDVGWRLEELLDLVGIGEHYERSLTEEPDRKAPPVAGAAALEVSRRTTPPASRLQRGGHARSRGQFSLHAWLLALAYGANP